MPSTHRLLGISVIASAAHFACGGDGSVAADDANTAPRDEETTDAGSDASACPKDNELTYESFGAPFMLNYCTGCHSADLTVRGNAPVATNFDTLADVRSHLDAILQRATGDSVTMPPGGGPSATERSLLAQWIACGAPSSEAIGFMGLETHGSPMTPPYDGQVLEGRACGDPLEPLPPSELPRCTRKTHECVLDCEARGEGDNCKDNCYSEDTLDVGHGPCEDCATRQGLACASRTKCKDTVAAALCCLYTECATADCAETTCGREFRALSYCVAYEAPHCFDLEQNSEVVACFED